MVSYRLPYKTVEINGQLTRIQNSGGLVSAMSALSGKMPAEVADSIFNKKVIWVGKGESIDEPPSPKPNGPIMELINKVRGRANKSTMDNPVTTTTIKGETSNYQVVPVSIDPVLDAKYYGGFCNDCIWPLFHYFPSHVVHDESYFESYIEANNLFVDKIKAITEPGDFIWIHDYQLFLLPALLRKVLPHANIGFFLHIPFPTFEVFRIMPQRWREAILHGMLGADLVGFHTYDDSQYFLRTVSRLLGYEITMNSVSAEDRLVRVDAFPIGIDYDKFHDAATSSKEVIAEKNKILATLQNQKLIFSIDRLDYSKGLLLRLEAFEYFLETCPEWLEKIAFNMVVIPSRDSIPQYHNMRREIEATVGRINGKYSTMGWRPVVYQYRSISFAELVALYDLSLVGLITPIRDGMNLVAKEYVASQVTEKGVLILSEMAGAAAELNEALLINPTDKRAVADAIHKALAMSLRERTIRIARMQNRVKTYTVFAWAKDMLESLEIIKKEQEQRRVNIITPAMETAIINKYKDATRRAIFIDYDPTD